MPSHAPLAEARGDHPVDGPGELDRLGTELRHGDEQSGGYPIRADAGEETVGGTVPTPDQDIVEDLGRAVGITYEDDEPLHTTEKLEERDRHRWELDPASSENYDKRIKHEGEFEE